MNSDDIDDMILLAKACNENCKRSTETLYRKFRFSGDNPHKSYAQKHLDDSIHELFVRIMDNKLKFEGKGNPKGFLNKTIKNIQLEQFNNKLKFHSLQKMESNEKVHTDKDVIVPLHALETKERNKIIIDAISKLPPKSRQAIELVYFDGIQAKQAAESIGCEFRIFRNRLKYALKKLKEKLYIYIY